MNNLIVNLFEGLKTKQDKSFQEYLCTIQNGHDDGSVVIMAKSLMIKAANFYKNKLTQNELEQLSQMEKDVLVLKAKIHKMVKKATKQVTFNAPRKSKPKQDKEDDKQKKKHVPTWSCFHDLLLL